MTVWDDLMRLMREAKRAAERTPPRIWLFCHPDNEQKMRDLIAGRVELANVDVQIYTNARMFPVDRTLLYSPTLFERNVLDPFWRERERAAHTSTAEGLFQLLPTDWTQTQALRAGRQPQLWTVCQLGHFEAPSACKWCGVDQRMHGQRFVDVENVGWHSYVAPQQWQIKARMRARRRR